MLLLYRLLGIAASIGSGMSRVRLNFVSLSLFPVIGLFFPIFTLFEAIGDYREGKTPNPVSLGQVAKEGYSGHKYVSVMGQYDPEVAFESSVKHRFSTTPGKNYIALTDPESHGAVMVAMNPGVMAGVLPGRVTLSGILEPFESKMIMQLPPLSEGEPISHLYFLNLGAAPHDPADTALMGVTFGIPLAFYAVAFFRLYIIFRKTPAAAPVPPPASVVDFDTLPLVRATGRFWPHTGDSGRFLNVPAVLGRLGGGEICLYSNIDASSSQRIYGIQVSKEELAGYWVIPINPDSLSEIEMGELFPGWSPRRAIRIRFNYGPTSYLETVILTFDSPEDRIEVVRALLSPAEEPFILN